MFAKIRARWRVIAARHKLNRFAGSKGVVHFVPLEDHPSEVVPLPVTERPTLCGKHVENPGNGTVQPDIVSCYQCALGIESDRKRWLRHEPLSNRSRSEAAEAL